MRYRAALLAYAINGLASVGLGGLYLFRSTFMPYHAEAVGLAWEELPPAFQVLLESLLDVTGAGWLGVGVAVLVLTAVPVRRGERWARLLVPGLLLLFYVPTLFATLTVLDATPATPPWYGNAAACLTTLLGVMCDAPWRARP